MRHRAQTPRRQIESDCDQLWQKLIFTLFHGRCGVPFCASNFKLAGHHINGRSCKHLRHSILNGFLICGLHHSKAESDKGWFIDMLQTHYPDRAEFYFEHKNDQSQLVWTSHLMETRSQLQQLLENLR